MANVTKAEIKRIIGALKRTNKKVVDLKTLSRLTGLYPNILGEKLRDFSPLIMMDPTINVRDILPDLEKFIEEPLEAKKKKETIKRVVVRKKELQSYKSINDFVFKKMTSVGGLVDNSVVLSDEDLAVLGKLVKFEQDKRAKKAKSHKKK